MKIAIVINKDGFVSKVLSDEPIDDVVTIDFCTDDPDEQEEAETAQEDFEADPEYKYHYDM